MADNNLALDPKECRLFISAFEGSIYQLREQPDFIDIVIGNPELLQVNVLGLTNHRRLYDNLSTFQRREVNNGDDAYNDQIDYPVTIGAYIYVPIKAYNFPYTYQSNVTVSKSIGAQYFPPILKALTNDPGYVPAEKNRGLVNKTVFPQLTVWIWSRNKYVNDSVSMGWLNVSAHVINVNVDSDITSSGGTFSLELAPINATVRVDDEQGTVYFDLAGQYANHFSASSTKPELYLTFGKNRQVGAETTRQRMYYQSVLMANDLVFISFDKLNIDGRFDAKDVANKWYDFQGMIDSVEVDCVGQINDVKITIGGRDLSKAMMDDNSYFNPFSLGHINSLYGGKPGTRFLRGDFQELSTVPCRNIEQQIGFILHRIASVNYVPDDIFDGFANLTEITSYLDQTKPAQGIYKLFKVFIDDNIRQLRLVDDSIANPNGNILDLIRKSAQMPFVEFFCDTYGDKYYLILRQPPFTQQALRDMMKAANVYGVDQDFKQYQGPTQTNSGNADYTVNRYLEATTDYYNKIKAAQQPQVKYEPEEVNQEAELPIIEQPTSSGGDLETGLGVTVVRSIFPGVVNIEEIDVVSDSLRFNNESYAWYKLTDRGNFAGQSVGLGEIQNIYFDQIAQIFGNKLYEVTSNYSDYKFFMSRDTEKDKNLYAEQASQLLTFMIETTIYLPFTRTGTITVNRDRRLKKGQWIYYRPTKEFYYIDAVSHNMNVSADRIDGTTTIQVSRGMYGRFIEGVDVSDQDGSEAYSVSYFDIVDIWTLRQNIYDTISGKNVDDKFNYKADIKINEKVLRYLLQNRQSLENDSENGL